MIVGPKKSLYKENILRFNTNEFKKKYKVEVVFEETIYDRTRIVYEVSVENLEVIASGNYLCYFPRMFRQENRLMMSSNIISYYLSQAEFIRRYKAIFSFMCQAASGICMT